MGWTFSLGGAKTTRPICPTSRCGSNARWNSSRETPPSPFLSWQRRWNAARRREGVLGLEEFPTDRRTPAITGVFRVFLLKADQHHLLRVPPVVPIWSLLLPFHTHLYSSSLDFGRHNQPGATKSCQSRLSWPSVRVGSNLSGGTWSKFCIRES